MTMYKDLTPQEKYYSNIRNNEELWNKHLEVQRVRAKERYKKPEVRERHKEWSRERWHLNANEAPWKNALQRCKVRSRKSKIECTINADFLKSIWTDVCPILGIPLIVAKGKMTDNSPSVDRIDPSKGYVPGNVVVISNRANMIKNCGTLEEHRAIVSFLESRGTGSSSCSL